MKLYLIRHGMTKGNREKRYVGSTDEELLPEERECFLKRTKESSSAVKKVFVSPLLRCRQTAGLLYPGIVPVIVEDFRECDFGLFEYKNSRELEAEPAYRKYLSSMGKSGFPEGETKEEFQKRCREAFLKIASDLKREGCLKRKDSCEAALVVHGGTIMALLDEFSVPHGDYFSWQVKNLEGYVCELCMDKDGTVSLRNPEKIDERMNGVCRNE